MNRRKHRRELSGTPEPGPSSRPSFSKRVKVSDNRRKHKRELSGTPEPGPSSRPPFSERVKVSDNNVAPPKATVLSSLPEMVLQSALVDLSQKISRIGSSMLSYPDRDQAVERDFESFCEALSLPAHSQHATPDQLAQIEKSGRSPEDILLRLKALAKNASLEQNTVETVASVPNDGISRARSTMRMIQVLERIDINKLMGNANNSRDNDQKSLAPTSYIPSVLTEARKTFDLTPSSDSMYDANRPRVLTDEELNADPPRREKLSRLQNEFCEIFEGNKEPQDRYQNCENFVRLHHRELLEDNRVWNFIYIPPALFLHNILACAGGNASNRFNNKELVESAIEHLKNMRWNIQDVTRDSNLFIQKFFSKEYKKFSRGPVQRPCRNYTRTQNFRSSISGLQPTADANATAHPTDVDSAQIRAHSTSTATALASGYDHSAHSEASNR